MIGSRRSAFGAVLAAGTMVAACTSSSTPTTADSSAVSTASAPSTSSTPLAGPTSSASSGVRTSSPTSSSSSSGSAGSHGAGTPWSTPQSLPTTTAPAGSTLAFDKITYDTIDGGWQLDARFVYRGSGNGPLIYFALKTGNASATPATPFRLSKTATYHVFVAGPKSPHPTQVIVFGSDRHGKQGGRLLAADIPASAFGS